jgi:hypothetical protein
MMSPRGNNTSVKRGGIDNKMNNSIVVNTQRQGCESPIKSTINVPPGYTNQLTGASIVNDRKNASMVESILYNKALQSVGKPREIVRQYLKRQITNPNNTE